MNTVRHILGAYAVLLAVAVGAHFIITPLYDDGSTGFPVWRVFNWFMAAGVIIALTASLIWKLRLDKAGAEGLDLKRCLEVNAIFYASVVLGLWFFWNWFGNLMSRAEPLLWAFIDPLLVVVVGACGIRLWRNAGNAG